MSRYEYEHAHWQDALLRLVEWRYGVHLRQAQLDGALLRLVTRRCQALGLSNNREYVDLLLRSSSNGEENSHLLSAMSVGYTFFFRHLAQLQVAADIAEQVFVQGGRAPRIWCVACSTGEEAYSLAMLLADRQVPVRMKASDIHRQAIDTAQTAQYPIWKLKNLPVGSCAQYLDWGGSHVRVRDRIRSRIQFSVHNVLDAPLLPELGGGWDIILCRNILIYLTPWATRRVGLRLSSALASSGFLLLGSGETAHGAFSPLMREGQIVYGLQSATSLEKGSGRDSHARYLTLSDATQQAQVQPQRQEPWMVLGNLLLCAHRFDEAESAYLRAQEIEPASPEVLYFLGVVSRKKGKLNQAEMHLQQALSLAPTFWPASYLLAGVAARLGQRERQLDLLRLTLHSLSEDAQRKWFAMSPESFCPSAEEVVQLSHRILRV